MDPTEGPQDPEIATPPASGSGLLLAALILAIGLALLLPLLRPLLPVDETRYLTVAWEMHGTGSYFVPHLNGEIYTHKPPLLFWLINLVWAVTGVSEGAARMVAPAFGVAAVGLTWILGRRLWPGQQAVAGTAALILATTGIFALYGSLTMFDTMLSCAVLVGVIALIALDQGADRKAVLLLGAALGFGVFAKGPVILVHLMPLALTRPLWSAGLTRLGYGSWLLRIAAAVGVALVIVAVWLGPALILGGDAYRNDVLWRQSAGRMVNAFDHARPAWFFVAALPVLLWPWAWRGPALKMLSPGRIVASWQTRLLAIWFVATVALFSLISGKQIHYMLPALPAAALLLSQAPAPRRAFGPPVLAGMVVVPVLIWALALALGKARIDHAVVAGGMVLPLLVAAVLAAGAAAVLTLMARRAPLLAMALVAPATLAIVHLALWGATFQLFNPDRFAEELGRAQDLGIAHVGSEYQGEFGFAARLTQPVTLLQADGVAAWAAGHPGGLIISALADPLPYSLVQQGHFAGDDLSLYRASAP